MIFLENFNKVDKTIEEVEIKNQIKTLENFYVNAQLDNLPELVEQRKEEIVNEVMDYKEKHTQLFLDRQDNPIEKIKITPFIVSNYFFRSINNLQNIEPKYSGEHLSILWNLYLYMVEQVNLNLCEFAPSISHFCKFIGITTVGLKKMLKSPDEGIKTVVQKIYDVCYDERMTMSEVGKFNPRATTFRIKSEMEINEKEKPQVVINANNVNFDEINKRIEELTNFDKRVNKIKVAEAKYEEKF